MQRQHPIYICRLSPVLERLDSILVQSVPSRYFAVSSFEMSIISCSEILASTKQNSDFPPGILFDLEVINRSRKALCSC